MLRRCFSDVPINQIPFAMYRFTIKAGTASLLQLLLTFSCLFAQQTVSPDLDRYARDQAAEFNRKKAAAVEIARAKGWPVRFEYPDGRIVEIMELGASGLPEYETTDNANAAATSGTNNLWPGGAMGLSLTGDIILIGEWDGGGVRTTHQEFRVGTGPSRVVQRDAPAGNSNHSTHVAGTLVAEGQVASAHGMAPFGSLDAYDWNNDISEMGTAYSNDDILLSNHSYGRIRGWENDNGTWYWYGDITVSTTEDYQFGFYGPLAKKWDSLARLCPQYLIVKSAGNDRDDDWNGGHYVYSGGSWVWSTASRDPDGGADGYDCIENRAVAKNILTVGAVDQITGGYSQPSDVVMTGFSNWGPTDDGRIKPDIVADGASLYSTIATLDNAYDYIGGTSMSSPAVCGSLALLQEYYHDLLGSFMYADQLKALVLNTADEAGPADGPDYQFGWGLLNTDGAANLIHKHDSLGNIIRRSYLSNGETETYTYYSDGNSPLKVTICWIDPAHDTLAHALNPTTSHLVHDLDLRVLTPTGGTAYPWRLNPASPGTAADRGDNYRDNVETVFITSPPAGKYIVQVNHKGAISGQYYGLVVSGLQYQRFTNTWTGGGTTDYWYVNGNWSLGHDPVEDELAVIPNGSAFHAIVDVADGVCYSLNLGADAWLEIRDNTLTMKQNLMVYGNIEMDNAASEMNVEGNVYCYSGSTFDIQVDGPMIWAYGNWHFYSGTNIQMNHGTVNLTGTNAAYVYSYDSDACFYNLGIYKSEGGYVEHHSLSSNPLRTNNYLYLHFNSEFRSNTSQPVIINGYFSKAPSAVCNLNMGTIVLDGTSGSINFDGAGYFNNLTISPSTSVTLLDNITIRGDLLIEQGTFAPGTHRIYLTGNWTNTVGDAGFNETGSRVYFNDGDGGSYLHSNENFDTLTLAIFDALYINDAGLNVTCDHFDWSGGIMTVANSSVFTAEDLVQSAIYGYWVVGVGATVNLYQDAGTGQYVDLYGHLTIAAGTMNIYGGSDDSYWAYGANNTLNLSSGGVLDFVNRGIFIYDDFNLNENITGGTIRTAGSFQVYRTDFNPTGGTIECRGSTDGYISHGVGSNFYSLRINKYGAADGEPDRENLPLHPRNVGPTGQSSDNHLISAPVSVPGNSRAPMNQITLGSNLDLNGDLVIDNGILDVSASNYQINIGGNWTNNVELVGFNERNGTVTFDGGSAKDIITSETFYNLVLDKTYSGTLGLEVQDYVKVNNNLTISDGTMELNPSSLLDILGDLTIASGACLNADDDPTTIRIWGDWTDNNASITSLTGFFPGYFSTVYFYGEANQYVNTAASPGLFNNITISLGGSTLEFRPYDNLELRGDLNILSGWWHDASGGLTHSFRKNFTITGAGGGFSTNMGTDIRFIGSNDQVISWPLEGGYFGDMIVDKFVADDGGGSRSNTVTLATHIYILNGHTLFLQSGTLDLNGHYIRGTGDTKIYNGGIMEIGDDAWLEVGGGDSLIVYSGGSLRCVGSAGHLAKVKAHSATYSFTVQSGGALSARHARFESMDANGVNCQSGSVIDAANDFDFCSFQNGVTASGTLLTIDNNQTLTVDSASFLASTTTYNVKKALNQGNVTFVGATGPFAGPLYENDPNARIHWAEHGKWDGSVSTDWNTAGNWGFDIVPTASIDVTIPAGCPYYPDLTNRLGVNTTSYEHDCKSLNIQTCGRLIISSNSSLFNYGTITVNGLLSIGNDYNGYSPSVLNLQSDSVKLGTASVDGRLTLYSGATVNQTGGALMAESLNLNSGSQYNGSSFGMVHIYVHGTAPATQGIYIFDPDSYFSNFCINAGSNASMLTSTEILDINSSFQVEGTFKPYGKTVTATFMDIYGTVIIDSGLIVVENNGPYLHDGASLQMNGGVIDAGNYIRCYSGSSAAGNGGEIYVEDLIYFYSGSDIGFNSGHTVYFSAPGTSTIYCLDDNASFGTVLCNKTAAAASITVIHSSSTYPMNVAGNLIIRNGNHFNMQGESLNISGQLVSDAGSELIAAAGSNFAAAGDLSLNGVISNTGGNFVIHGDFSETSSGSLDLFGGSFVCDHALSADRSIYSMAGAFTMNDGVLEICHNHLSLTSTFLGSISGGTIRVGGSFMASDNVFQPSGGTVELVSYSGMGIPYIDLHNGNWFANLIINGSNTWAINGAGQVAVNKDLTIEEGNLLADNDIIYVGDDWVNNVGQSGFSCGTGTVYLTGVNPSPDRQMISGENTFYHLVNQNTNSFVEFAGPVTVLGLYEADGAGSASQTVVSGSPANFKRMHLTAGWFSLTTGDPAVTVDTLFQGGNIQLTSGSFTANDLNEPHVIGDYILFNGQIDLYQDQDQYVDLEADITIQNGQFNIHGGLGEDCWWPYTGDGSLTMSGGVLDIKDQGIFLNNDNFTENITGGVIRTSGYFHSTVGITFFTPSGGSVELYGSGTSLLYLPAACYFHDLWASKEAGSAVSAASPLWISHELKVNSGLFSTNAHLVTVGD